MVSPSDPFWQYDFDDAYFKADDDDMDSDGCGDDMDTSSSDDDMTTGVDTNSEYDSKEEDLLARWWHISNGITTSAHNVLAFWVEAIIWLKWEMAILPIVMRCSAWH